MIAKSMTLMIPYRNRNVAPFRVTLETLKRQTLPFDEVVVADLASDEPFKSDVESLCREYEKDLNINYVYTAVEAPNIPKNILDKILSVHLWQINYNIGIRNSKSDLVFISGLDRVFEPNLAEYVLWMYNYTSKVAGNSMICSRVFDLYRVPEISELNNMNALFAEAKWRGGYGFITTSKSWLHKVHGFDESIRWCADIDIATRAKLDKVPVYWISHGQYVKKLDKVGRVLHLNTHAKSGRSFGGIDVVDISRRGKWFIHRTDGNRKVIRNDENWGIFTEEKLQKAYEKTQMTLEELNESLRIRREDPKKWLEIYA